MNVSNQYTARMHWFVRSAAHFQYLRIFLLLEQYPSKNEFLSRKSSSFYPNPFLDLLLCTPYVCRSKNHICFNWDMIYILVNVLNWFTWLESSFSTSFTSSVCKTLTQLSPRFVRGFNLYSKILCRKEFAKKALNPKTFVWTSEFLKIFILSISSSAESMSVWSRTAVIFDLIKSRDLYNTTGLITKNKFCLPIYWLRGCKRHTNTEKHHFGIHRRNKNKRILWWIWDFLNSNVLL